MLTKVTDRQAELIEAMAQSHVKATTVWVDEEGWHRRGKPRMIRPSPERKPNEELKSLSDHIAENAHALSHRLGVKAKNLENILGHFARRTPSQERADLVELLTLTLLEANPNNPAHCFGICKRRHAMWYRHYTIRQHYSLDACLEDDTLAEQERGLREFLAGCVEYEAIWNGQLDGEALWAKLPEAIKPIVMKRMIGKRTSNTERSTLNRWLKREGWAVLASIG